MIVVFNIYKNKKGKVSITVQGSGDKTKAEKIKDDFKIQEKEHEEIASDFADFIKNRSGIELVDKKKMGDAWRIEAKIEDDGASKQG